MARARELGAPPAAGRPGGPSDQRLRVTAALAAMAARLDDGAREPSLSVLGSIATEAEQLGLAGEALGARLSRSEILLLVRPAEGREALAAVEDEAQRRGYGRIARRAAIARGSNVVDAAAIGPGDGGGMP